MMNGRRKPYYNNEGLSKGKAFFFYSILCERAEERYILFLILLILTNQGSYYILAFQGISSAPSFWAA